MQRKSSWLIPSKAEWEAMRWGGLYVLAGSMLLRIFLWPLLLGPFGGYNPWAKPLILLSQALTDSNSLIMYWRIPSLLASGLCGMLGGLFVYRWLRRKARQRPLTSGDGWRAGAVVGAWFGISLAVLYIVAPYGIFPTIRRIAQEVPRLSGWGTRQYLNVLLVVTILTLFMAAVGAVLGKLLYGRGIAADLEPEADLNARGGEGMAYGPGCMWLLVLAFFTMYFYGDASRLLSKIPLPPPTFMRTGDFGIVSQEPCGPPCFQGITPGVTTIKDAYLNMLKAGAPCRMYESRFEAAAPIDREGVSCNSGNAYIGIESPIGFGQQRETDEAKVVVNSITLKPPTNVTVGQLLAAYGPPDAVREYTGQESSGAQSFMFFYYDKLQTYVEFPMQPAAAYAVAPGTTIERVTYGIAADHQRGNSSESSRQPWKGYGMYALGTAFLSAPPPTMTPNDFGIISREPCGPPCFQGIRPGITNLEDASQIVFQLGASCTVSGGTSEGGTRLKCQDGDASIDIVANGQDGAKLLVDSISLLDFPVKVTVGEFITQYGFPEELLPLVPDNGGADPALLLAYDRLHTVVIAFTPPGQAYRIAPDTKITFVNYLSPAQYDKILSWQISMGIRSRPWEGYGTYLPMVVPPPTLMPLPTPASTPTPA